MAKGMVLAFGPVADPKGAYGIAVVQLENGADTLPLADNDPVIKANAGFSFEIHPMPQLLHPSIGYGDVDSDIFTYPTAMSASRFHIPTSTVSARYICG